MRSIFYGAARDMTRTLRLPPNARCKTCGRTDPLDLLPETKPRVCADCGPVGGPKPSRQEHHPFGDANDPVTFSFRPSSHRFFTDRQEDWPTETLTNPDGCPTLRRAAALRSFGDTIAFLEERVIRPYMRDLRGRHVRGCDGSA